MAKDRSRGTLVDYLVAAIEPVLIMIMVGSLMFFLLDLWYEGPVLDRLRWILFWFVFGIVLITRVSMQIGSVQAQGYGVALGGAVALVATVLGGFQPFLLMVMGVVWWATHKLTFDCTLLDEDQDAGVGLLQESGLEPVNPDEPIHTPRDAKTHSDPDEMDASLLPQRPWWKLWEVDSGEARRPHAPGVTLVYFTLASLPIFGIGQWFVPAVDEDRRTGLFLYFLAYIASGMGLLLATSFLNLRRYLRQRKVKMPGAMTATWLSTGAILIVGLTAAAAVLPLPIAGLKAMRGSTTNQSDLRASEHVILKDSGVQGEGTPSEGPAASKSGSPPKSSGKAKGSGKTNDPNASQQTNGQGKPGGNSGQGRSKSGAPRGKPAPSQGGQQGKKGAAQDQSGDQGKKGDQSGEQAKGDQAKGQDGRSKDQAERGKDAEADSKQSEEKGSEQGDEKSSAENPNPSDGGSPPLQLPPIALTSLAWLKGPIMVVGILILIFGLFRYGGVLLQALRALIAALLSGFWFGGPRKPKKDEEVEEEKAPPPRPFASYVNPFDAGLDHQFSPNDLVIYSFEALEAWAYENELARSPHETPSEFVQRLGQARGELSREATRLVGFFVTIVYGDRGFKDEVLPALRQFWQALRS
ncbi:MAG: DUF4129 domain-containing protein [Isosphaeraceae bacterium]